MSLPDKLGIPQQRTHSRLERQLKSTERPLKQQHSALATRRKATFTWLLSRTTIITAWRLHLSNGLKERRKGRIYGVHVTQRKEARASDDHWWLCFGTREAEPFVGKSVVDFGTCQSVAPKITASRSDTPVMLRPMLLVECRFKLGLLRKRPDHPGGNQWENSEEHKNRLEGVMIHQPSSHQTEKHASESGSQLANPQIDATAPLGNTSAGMASRFARAPQ